MALGIQSLRTQAKRASDLKHLHQWESIGALYLHEARVQLPHIVLALHKTLGAGSAQTSIVAQKQLQDAQQRLREELALVQPTLWRTENLLRAVELKSLLERHQQIADQILSLAAQGDQIQSLLLLNSDEFERLDNRADKLLEQMAQVKQSALRDLVTQIAVYAKQFIYLYLATGRACISDYVGMAGQLVDPQPARAGAPCRGLADRRAAGSAHSPYRSAKRDRRSGAGDRKTTARVSYSRSAAKSQNPIIPAAGRPAASGDSSGSGASLLRPHRAALGACQGALYSLHQGSDSLHLVGGYANDLAHPLAAEVALGEQIGITLARVEQSLTPVLNALAGLDAGEQEPVPSVVVPEGELQPRLAKLSRLLAESDSEALDVLQELRGQPLGQGLVERLARVAQQMEHYDFGAALALLEE
ncbi:hypothetical protein [Aeromonas sanarellii]|uniref:hypothetical protein n=1 Tax=Aeromonas sanarellii TaxID=633415 RepID=UPI003BA0A936